MRLLSDDVIAIRERVDQTLPAASEALDVAQTAGEQRRQDHARSERELREALQLVRHDVAYLQARGQEERKKGGHWGETSWTELPAMARWEIVGLPLGGYRSLNMVTRSCSYPYRIADQINRLAAERTTERGLAGGSPIPSGGIYQLDELIKATTDALTQIDAALARDSLRC
jgi:hypothetical protein